MSEWVSPDQTDRSYLRTVLEHKAIYAGFSKRAGSKRGAALHLSCKRAHSEDASGVTVSLNRLCHPYSTVR